MAVPEPSGMPQLHSAAFSGQAQQVAQLLQARTHAPSVNELWWDITCHLAADCQDWTPLLLAAKVGHAGVIRHLLDAGAAVDLCNSQYRNTALILAASGGHLECVRVLCSWGAGVNRRREDGLTALHAACMFGHTNVVDALLRHHASVDARSGAEETPLYLAARGGHLEIVRKLRDMGCDVDAANADRQTPLYAAAARGRRGVVEELQAAGAVLDMQSRQGWTALTAAASGGHAPVVQLLVRAGAAVQQREVDAAGQQGHTEIGEFLDACLKGWTPLHFAAESNDVSMAQQLLRQRSWLECKTTGPRRVRCGMMQTRVYPPGLTALAVARQLGHQELAGLLTNAPGRERWGQAPISTHGSQVSQSTLADPRYPNRGALPPQQGNQLHTSYSMASQPPNGTGGNVQTVLNPHAVQWQASLASQGVQPGRLRGRPHSASSRSDPQPPSPRASTTLTDAALRVFRAQNNSRNGGRASPNDVGAGSQLVQNAAMASPLGYLSTPHGQAAYRQAVGADVTSGADVITEASTSSAMPELHAACQAGNIARVQQLANEAAGRQAQGQASPLELHWWDVHGLLSPSQLQWTPLQVAAFVGHAPAVRILLSSRARPDYCDDIFHKTPLFLAASGGHVTAATELLATGARVDVPDCDGRTPLFIAAINGQLESVRVLLQGGADCERVDKYDNTPLVEAVFGGHLPVAQALLGRGARVTPKVWDAARDKGDPMVVQLLQLHTAQVTLRS